MKNLLFSLVLMTIVSYVSINALDSNISKAMNKTNEITQIDSDLDVLVHDVDTSTDTLTVVFGNNIRTVSMENINYKPTSNLANLINEVVTMEGGFVKEGIYYPSSIKLN